MYNIVPMVMTELLLKVSSCRFLLFITTPKYENFNLGCCHVLIVFDMVYTGSFIIAKL